MSRLFRLPRRTVTVCVENGQCTFLAPDLPCRRTRDGIERLLTWLWQHCQNRPSLSDFSTLRGHHHLVLYPTEEELLLAVHDYDSDNEAAWGLFNVAALLRSSGRSARDLADDISLMRVVGQEDN